MIDRYPRYAELLQKRDAGGGYTEPGFSRPAGVAQARVGRSVLSRQRRARAAARREAARLQRGRQRRSCARSSSRFSSASSPSTARPPSAGRSSCRRRRSTTRFFRCCATPTSISGRTRRRRCRARAFRRPEDAAEQLARARECHQRLFGHEPAGLWPSEGSVSDETRRAGRQGRAFSGWRPTKRFLDGPSAASFAATRRVGSSIPSRCTGRMASRSARRQIACLFRDHALSDLIGFVYAGWQAEDAAADFVHRLVEAGRRFSASSGGEEAIISVILDGENAWEHFEGGGRPFLRALYGMLSAHPELRPVTMSEAAARPRRMPQRHLSRLVDRRQLLHLDRPRRRPARLAAAARRAPDVRPRLGRRPTRRTASRRSRSCSSPKAATGSGGTATTTRRTTTSSSTSCSGGISGTCIRCSDSRARGAVRHQHQHEPRAGFGRTAGRPDQPGARRAVDQLLRVAAGGDRRDGCALRHDDRASTANRRCATLLFGFDLERLYLRLDFGGPAGQRLAQGLRCSVNFTTPPTTGWCYGDCPGPDRRAAPEGLGRHMGASVTGHPGRRRGGDSRSVHPVRGSRAFGPTAPSRSS